MAGNMHDVIIVGGGPGGLTAAIYTSRDMLDTLLLEKAVCGGMPAVTDIIENYPGFPDGICGIELVEKFKKQAERFGTKIAELSEVKKVEPAGRIINVTAESGEYRCHALIVASGSLPRKLDVPGETRLTGKGVSYCAVCDGPLYRNKDVAVLGCGDSGLQEGEYLAKHARTVTFIATSPRVSATQILYERLKKNDKARFLVGQEILSINGDEFVNSISLRDRKTNEEKTVKVDGVFIYKGFLPNCGFLEGLVEIDQEGYIITNERMETSVMGIYAVGDIRSKRVRQIAVASGEGTVAALFAGEYIHEIKRKGA
jgi:thioredoxin reductase (NADPH)